MNFITSVGLDVHKATVSVAVAEGRGGGEALHVGVFPNRPDQIAKLVKRLGRNGRQLSFYDIAWKAWSASSGGSRVKCGRILQWRDPSTK